MPISIIHFLHECARSSRGHFCCFCYCSPYCIAHQFLYMKSSPFQPDPLTPPPKKKGSATALLKGGCRKHVLLAAAKNGSSIFFPFVTLLTVSGCTTLWHLLLYFLPISGFISVYPYFYPTYHLFIRARLSF